MRSGLQSDLALTLKQFRVFFLSKRTLIEGQLGAYFLSSQNDVFSLLFDFLVQLAYSVLHFAIQKRNSLRTHGFFSVLCRLDWGRPSLLSSAVIPPFMRVLFDGLGRRVSASLSVLLEEWGDLVLTQESEQISLEEVFFLSVEFQSLHRLQTGTLRSLRFSRENGRETLLPVPIGIFLDTLLCFYFLEATTGLELSLDVQSRVFLEGLEGEVVVEIQ